MRYTVTFWTDSDTFEELAEIEADGPDAALHHARSARPDLAHLDASIAEEGQS